MGNLSWVELIYWGFTILGGTFLLLRILFMFIGGGIDVDMDTDVSDIDISDSASSFDFNFFSIQSLTAFFLMFGLVGLMLESAGLPIIITMFGGGVAGLITMGVIGFLFSQIKHLRSEGTLNVNNTIGQTGSVYLNIPANGSGQVQVVVQGSLKIFDAVPKTKMDIAYGEKIKVVGVADSQTLIVEKLTQ